MFKRGNHWQPLCFHTPLVGKSMVFHQSFRPSEARLETGLSDRSPSFAPNRAGMPPSGGVGKRIKCLTRSLQKPTRPSFNESTYPANPLQTRSLCFPRGGRHVQTKQEPRWHHRKLVDRRLGRPLGSDRSVSDCCLTVVVVVSAQVTPVGCDSSVTQAQMN